MRFLKLLIGLIVVVIVAFLALAFITHNQAVASVNWLIWEPITAPVYAWLIGVFVLGGLLGLLFSSFLIAKERSARRRAERRLESTSKMMSGYIS